MAPQQQLINWWGGSSTTSTSRQRCIFGWESVAIFFDVVPLEVRREIWSLGAREFGEKLYHSDFEVCVGRPNWYQTQENGGSDDCIVYITYLHTDKWILCFTWCLEIRRLTIINYSLVRRNWKGLCGTSYMIWMILLFVWVR